jgi:ATP-binding cassette, subfamily F, member 3
MSSQDLIHLRDIKKYYPGKTIFDNAEMVITSGKKYAVIGRNGAGKSTLLKIIMNEEEEWGGTVDILPNCRIGYVPQHDPWKTSDKIEDFLVESTGGEKWKAHSLLREFDFKTEDFTKTIGEFSGGYQMRIKLVYVLLQNPNLLMLDEPTNYLDLNTLLMLEEFILTFKGTVMVISHDREFLKKTCDTTVEIVGGQIELYNGGLEEYFQYRAEQREFAKTKNKSIESKAKQLQTFVDRFGAKASKASAAKNKEKQIERLHSQKIDLGTALVSARIRIPPIEAKKGTLVDLHNIQCGYGDKVVCTIKNVIIERGEKIALLGENGQGKSTVIKSLSGLLPTLSGEIKFKNNPKIAYYNQLSSLVFSPGETMESFVKRSVQGDVTEQERLSMLGGFLFKKDQLSMAIESLSGGEQSRLFMACMFLNSADVYLLDEPTNHLDMETVEGLSHAISKCVSTVIVVSHDRTFVKGFAQRILEVKNGELNQYNGDYDYYVWLQAEHARKLMQGLSPKTSDVEEKFKDLAAVTDKEKRKKLFEIEKQLKSLERRVAKFDERIKSEDDPALLVEKAKVEEEYITLLFKKDNL